MAAGRAADDVRAAIDEAGGALPFSTFVELALYGPHGFYTDQAGTGRAGRRGDFLTSPEVGPLFGAVVARFLDAEWERLERPDPFTVVDAGAGPGTLARAVLAARPTCAAALRYVAVEVSGSQRADHPGDVESVAALPGEPFVGVVLANEMLDNLPFRLAVHDGAWREAYVAVAPDGAFAEVLSAPFDPVPEVLPARAGHGARAPLQDAAAAWVAQARHLVRRGSVVVVDYARPSTAALVGLEWRAWLRTYRDHQRGEPPADRSGRSGHHGRRRPRPAAGAGRCLLTGAVPAAMGHRRVGRGGPAGVDGGGCRARSRRAAHAQSLDRGGRAARPGRPGRVQRRAVDCPDRLNGAR